MRRRSLLRFCTAVLAGAMTLGTAHANDFTTLKSLDGTSGSDVRGGLLLADDGLLYGTAYSGGAFGYGTLYRMNLDGSSFEVVRDFDRWNDGMNPDWGALIQGDDGYVYGTARLGGPGGGGTIYRVAPDGTDFSVVRAFNNRYSSYYDCHTGGYPGTNAGGWLLTSGIMQGRDGVLYGVTQGGGPYGNGTIFRVNADGTGFSVLQALGKCGEYVLGATPYGTLVEGPDGDDALYGTTLYRGSDGNHGVLFRIERDGSGYTILHSFGYGGGKPGAHPNGVMLGQDGRLYGRTTAGANVGRGAIWRVERDGTGMTVLRNLTYPDGQYHVGSMVQDADGVLYGSQRYYGTGGALAGTVFAMNPDGSDFTILYNFPTGQGDPMGAPVVGPNGHLFLTTRLGGAYGKGTVRGPLPPQNAPPTCSLPVPGPFMAEFGAALDVMIATDDEDGDELTVSYEIDPPQAPAGTTSLEYDGIDAVFSWTPTVDDLGQHTVTITVDDGDAQTSCSFEVCVVNLPPGCVQGENAFIINVNDSFTHAMTGVDDNPGDLLTVSHLGLPEGATMTPESGTTGAAPLDIVLEWTPQADVDQFGQHDIVIRVTDANGEVADCPISIFVLNRVPECEPSGDAASVAIGEPVALSLLGYDGDAGDELTVSVDGELPDGAAVAQFGANPAEALFEWTPTVNDVGTHAIDIRFTDVGGASIVCSLEVTVYNRAPECDVALDDVEFPVEPCADSLPGQPAPADLTVTVGQVFSAVYTATDADPGDVLTVSASGVPASASLTPGDGASGSSPLATAFAWEPVGADARPEPYPVAVTFTDLNGAQSTCTLNISVNRPPAAICAAGPMEGVGESGSDITLECDASTGRYVTLDGSASTDPDGDELTYRWDVAGVTLDDPAAAVAHGEFPMGITMATLTVSDGRGGITCCDVVVTVVDQTPPEVMITTDKASLWPPKHDMREVTLYVVATDECADPNLVLPLTVHISSNEPDDSNGDGSTTGDVNGDDGYTAPVEVTSDLVYDTDGDQWIGSVTLQLRAERSGGGDGRAYAIEVMVFDTNGNFTQTSCVVVVPHGRRKGGGN